MDERRQGSTINRKVFWSEMDYPKYISSISLHSRTIFQLHILLWLPFWVGFSAKCRHCRFIDTPCRWTHPRLQIISADDITFYHRQSRLFGVAAQERICLCQHSSISNQYPGTATSSPNTRPSSHIISSGPSMFGRSPRRCSTCILTFSKYYCGHFESKKMAENTRSTILIRACVNVARRFVKGFP